MKKITILSTALLAGLWSVLVADEVIKLGDITVTATQNEDLKKNEAPVSVDVITSETISEQGITTMAELFKYTSGVDAKTAGGSVMPVIRGLSGEQVLILVDGVRISDERPGGNHILSVDPAQIDRVELVKGPGSVLYGAGAIGGIANIITKKRSANDSDETVIGGEIGTGYESNNNAKSAKAHIGVSDKKFSLYAGGVKRKTDNSKSPNEELKFSFYDGYTAWLGGKYILGDWSGEVNAWQSKADIGIIAPKGFVEDYYSNETHNMVNSKLKYSSDIGLIREFELLVGWQEHNRHRIRKPNQSKLVDIEVDKDTKTLRGQWTLKPDDMHRVVTGVDMFDEDLTSARQMKGFPDPIAKFDDVPVIAPSSRTGVGIFVQDEWAYGEYLNITAGLRYDSVEAKTDGLAPPFFITEPQSDRDSSLSAELGAVYKFNKTSNVYLNVGRAFRAPTLIERYFFGPHDGPAQDRGNPDLNPETSLSFDAGVRTKSENYKLSVSAYYNMVDDLIRKILINPSDPVSSQIYQFQNISDARIYGAEIDARYYLDDAFTLLFSGSYVKGNDENEDRPLNSIPPAKIRYGVEYGAQWSDIDAIFELSAISAARQDNVGEGEKVTPGYTIVNLKANLIHNSGMSLSIHLDNLLDKVYFDHLSYAWQQLDYAAEGRNVKFELSYRF